MKDRTPRPIANVRLDGGRLCIDFVNTVHDRYAVVTEDYISTRERFVEWSRRTGALRDGEDISPAVLEQAGTSLMDDIRILRGAVDDLLAARIADLPIPAGSLVTLNYWLLEARKDQGFDTGGHLVVQAARDDPALPLKRIVLDLVDVIAGADSGAFRLARCANTSSCGWIFADTSKNGRRRWCSMKTCGSLSKMAASRRRSSAE